MSDKMKTAQERYRDRNREKWNEYERERAKQKYQTDEEYKKKDKCFDDCLITDDEEDCLTESDE